MAAQNNVMETDSVFSILIFNVVTLIPWVAVFIHSLNYSAGEDGPASMFLLVVAAVGTLFVLPFYSLAIYLSKRFNLKPFLKCFVVFSLTVVAVFCICSSFVWVKVGAGGAVVFLFAALGYAVCVIRLLKQIAGVIKIDAGK
ncbi:hypothetical protein [Pseudomonas sp. Ant30-3]|uniref:hypothetical protein n=1 Tax=Pseudomonas sp. Ant30-3 TaxID=1488328 RepID=UPI00126A6749|nr:hypothetical protein [Pseudomonas sp. Ant30-3]